MVAIRLLLYQHIPITLCLLTISIPIAIKMLVNIINNCKKIKNYLAHNTIKILNCAIGCFNEKFGGVEIIDLQLCGALK